GGASTALSMSLPGPDSLRALGIGRTVLAGPGLGSRRRLRVRFAAFLRRASAPGDAARVAGEAPRVGEGLAEQELDLGVGAAEFVACSAGQGVVDRGVQPEQDALTLVRHGHW